MIPLTPQDYWSANPVILRFGHFLSRIQLRIRIDIPTRPGNNPPEPMTPIEQHLQAALGYLQLGMYQDAWDELESLPPELLLLLPG